MGGAVAWARLEIRNPNPTLLLPLLLRPAAPEVCRGEAYQGRPADIWALGVSLYLFAYGELPFSAPGSVAELYEAISSREVPYPGHVALSPGLEHLFRRLLHRDPGQRMTAEEVRGWRRRRGARGLRESAGHAACRFIRALDACLIGRGTLTHHTLFPAVLSFSR